MISACADPSRDGKSETNCSSSPRNSVPISLQGSRCSASSMTPFASSHETALPEKLFIVSWFAFLYGISQWYSVSLWSAFQNLSPQRTQSYTQERHRGAILPALPRTSRQFLA